MDPKDLTALLESGAQTASELIVQYGMSVIGAVLLLIVGRIVAGWMRNRATHFLTRTKTDPSLVPFLSSLTYYLIMGVVLIAVLNLFGVETTSLIAVFGAASLAIGLALQGTLSNFASGAMLLIFRPIRVNDFVEVAGQAGTVQEIALFNTIMHTGDNVRIVIPNAKVYGDIVKNYSYNNTRRIDLVMGISYADEIGQAIEIIERVIAADPRTLHEPAPTVAVSELADSSVNLIVRPWCNTKDYWQFRWDLIRKLKEELEAGGCSIPFPQQDVHVIQMPPR